MALAWPSIPPEFHCIDDVVLWSEVLRRGHSRGHTGRATVAYRTKFPKHYEHFGEPAPERAHSGAQIAAALRKWRAANP